MIVVAIVVLGLVAAEATWCVVAFVRRTRCGLAELDREQCR